MTDYEDPLLKLISNEEADDSESVKADIKAVIDIEAKRQRVERALNRPHAHRTTPCIKEFEFGAYDAQGLREGRIDVYPQPIKGDFIALWGTEPHSKVERLRVWNTDLLTTSFPAFCIEPKLDMAESVRRYLEELKAPFTGYGALNMPTAEVGTLIRIDISGPVTHAVLFGRTLR